MRKGIGSAAGTVAWLTLGLAGAAAAGTSDVAYKKVEVYISRGQIGLQEARGDEAPVRKPLVIDEKGEDAWARTVFLDDRPGRYDKPQVLHVESEQEARTEFYAVTGGEADSSEVRFYVIRWPE
ncbi:MAG: hypothetical protein Kow0092_21650 [Deferrisomatales bacterium]